MDKYTTLNWDSDFFGFRVARLQDVADTEIQEVLKDLTSHHYRLAVLFSGDGDSAIHRGAADNNGLLVDRKVTYARPVPDAPLTAATGTTAEMNIRVNPPDLKPEDLFDLAYLAGSYSRFRTDKNFPENDFKRLYTQWVINSLNGRFADYTLVHRDNQGTGGFATLKTEGDVARIGLISVDTGRQNQGIGKALVNETLKICIGRHIPVIEVDTQLDNTQACRFYEKAGFSVKEVRFVHHFWLT
jgi:ribosomal protein S18 acetylase RimI-like enzyme